MLAQTGPRQALRDLPLLLRALCWAVDAMRCLVAHDGTLPRDLGAH